jgi:isocitrate lyase
MVTQMAKYLDTVYVSGWQASSTASSTDEPGPDLADYPYVSQVLRYRYEKES